MQKQQQAVEAQNRMDNQHNNDHPIKSNLTSNDSIDIDDLIKQLSGDNLSSDPDPVLIDLDEFLKDIEESNNDDGF